MLSKKVLDYIDMEIKKGFRPSLIEEVLIERGFEKEEVRAGIKSSFDRVEEVMRKELESTSEEKEEIKLNALMHKKDEYLDLDARIEHKEKEEEEKEENKEKVGEKEGKKVSEIETLVEKEDDEIAEKKEDQPLHKTLADGARGGAEYTGILARKYFNIFKKIFHITKKAPQDFVEWRAVPITKRLFTYGLFPLLLLLAIAVFTDTYFKTDKFAELGSRLFVLFFTFLVISRSTRRLCRKYNLEIRVFSRIFKIMLILSTAICFLEFFEITKLIVYTSIAGALFIMRDIMKKEKKGFFSALVFIIKLNIRVIAGAYIAMGFIALIMGLAVRLSF